MQKIYLILRNNKQGGPYTLEELVALSLKPHDLIWVEGKSAGWRYPTEIESLKPYVSTPASSSGPSPAEAAGHRSKEALNAPRTGHIYISIPGKSEKIMVKPENAPAPPLPEEETPLTEEALEKKARELYQKVQAYAEKKDQASAEGVETKYAKSLDDLKQEYSDWLHKKKKSRLGKPIVVNKKAIGLTSLVAVVFLAGFIFARWLTGDAAKVQPLTENKVMSLQSEEASAASGTRGETHQVPLIQEPADREVKEEIPPSNPSIQDQGAYKPAGNTTRNASKARNQQAGSNPAEISSLIEKYTGQAVTTTQTPVKEEPPKKQVPLAQLVSMNGRYMKDDDRKNITGMEITVMNNSDQVVRSVAVKVSYHKKGGREFETETVYINNIAPHTPFTISRPGNKRAYSATFQIIQIQGNE